MLLMPGGSFGHRICLATAIGPPILEDVRTTGRSKSSTQAPDRELNHRFVTAFLVVRKIGKGFPKVGISVIFRFTVPAGCGWWAGINGRTRMNVTAWSASSNKVGVVEWDGFRREDMSRNEV